MLIANHPGHPSPMFVSQPTYAVPPKMAKDTVYMPSAVAARVLGTVVARESVARAPEDRVQRN